MIKKNYVYLCGGMEGYKEDEMMQWRAKATNILSKDGISTLDPTRRWKNHNDYEKRNNINRVVKMDLQDISNSTVLLCDMREDQPGKRWGSMAEIAHAHIKNKIIIVWRGRKDELHPFLEFYATEVHYSLEKCCIAIKDYFN